MCVCRFEELRSHIKTIKNSTKIRDVSRVSEGMHISVQSCAALKAVQSVVSAEEVCRDNCVYTAGKNIWGHSMSTVCLLEKVAFVKVGCCVGLSS